MISLPYILMELVVLLVGYVYLQMMHSGYHLYIAGKVSGTMSQLQYGLVILTLNNLLYSIFYCQDK